MKMVGGIPTHVFSLESRSPKRTPLVVVIPGSPGMAHFYIPFASKLFDIGQEQFDIAVVSHAGHSPGHYKDTFCAHGDANESTGSATDWYTLQDQITHKLAFIEEEAQDRELIFIGHSIGCWIILHMLKKLHPSKILHVFLLFPTIEKMAMTPNAQSLVSHLWSSLRMPFTALLWLSSRLIPYFVKKWVLSIHFSTTPCEHLQHLAQGTINIDEKSIYNILRMAKQEINEVVDPPLNVIDANIDKMVFYYGVGDRWNVDSCYRDMATRYPEKDVNLCQLNINHAFVECSSDIMAEYVHSKLEL